MDIEGGHSNAILVFILAALVLRFLLKSERPEPNLKHFPAIGRANYLLSYLDALRFNSCGSSELRRGYDKHRTRIFRISTLNRWLAIITGTRHIEELRKATEDEVSLASFANEPDAPLYSLGHCKAVAIEHLHGLTRQLTQNATFAIPGMREEIMLVLENAVSSSDVEKSGGWQEVDALKLVTTLTTHTINPVYFGLPYSRDKEFARLSMLMAGDVYGSGFPLLCTLLPKSVVSILQTFNASHQTRRRLHDMTISFVRDQKNRPRHEKDQTNYDLLSWMVNDPTPTLLKDIASNLFSLNVTANQMISITFGHVLYHLAANPKYTAPMRKEIESVATREGWSRNSLEKMRKVDSFIKESMRMSSISSVCMMRKIMTSFSFSDGTHLPQGTLVAVASEARHLDNTSYTSAEVFDGFRFSKVHEQQQAPSSFDMGGGMQTQFQMVTTTADYLAWGYGRHACPGRLFAGVALKMMLAHVVLYYDVRFADGVRPGDVHVGMNRLPDPNAKVLFRKR